jgi:hypothetical protein
MTSGWTDLCAIVRVRRSVHRYTLGQQSALSRKAASMWYLPRLTLSLKALVSRSESGTVQNTNCLLFVISSTAGPQCPRLQHAVCTYGSSLSIAGPSVSEAAPSTAGQLSSMATQSVTIAGSSSTPATSGTRASSP